MPQSARRRRRPDPAPGMDAPPIEPFQKRGKLGGAQPHDAVMHLRPAEGALLEPLGQQAHPGPVPVEKLHPIGETNVIPHTV
jgi:hypothetical protein